jgi:hypothetical protein
LKTNDLKKGAIVRLRNGWLAEIADNKKGNIRLAKVYGIETEYGSVYAHDIGTYFEERGSRAFVAGEQAFTTTGQPGLPGGVYCVHRIEHTPEQLKLKQLVEDFGF